MKLASITFSSCISFPPILRNGESLLPPQTVVVGTRGLTFDVLMDRVRRLFFFMILIFISLSISLSLLLLLTALFFSHRRTRTSMLFFSLPLSA